MAITVCLSRSTLFTLASIPTILCAIQSMYAVIQLGDGTCAWPGHKGNWVRDSFARMVCCVGMKCLLSWRMCVNNRRPL